MQNKTAAGIALLILALCSAGCSKESPEGYQLPAIDAATAEANKADAQRRGWIEVQPLTLAAAPEKK